MDRVLRANPNGASTVSSGGALQAVLCVISIAVLFRVVSPSSEETWQLPQRSTRPVSPHLGGARCRFFLRRFYTTVGLKRAECFCSGLLWRRRAGAATGRRSLASSIHAPSPNAPSRCFAHNAAILYTLSVYNIYK